MKYSILHEIHSRTIRSPFNEGVPFTSCHLSTTLTHPDDLEIVVTKSSCTHHLQTVSHVHQTLRWDVFTAIEPAPEITMAPAEFTTLTDTVPVVMPRNEKPLKPGLKC